MRRYMNSKRRKTIMRNRLFLGLLIILITFLGMRFKPEIKELGQKIINPFVNKEDDNSKDLDKDPVIKEPKIKKVELVSVGDIMFHSPQIRSANLGNGNYDFLPPFEYIRKYIEDADIAIANFETVTAGDNRSYTGFPMFNSPKSTITALKEVGFDILTTANNHSLDQGKKGVVDTIDFIKEAGLKSVGTYKDKDSEPLIEEVNEIRFGFLAYTYGLNGLEGYLTKEELSYMINLIDEEKIKKDIEELKSRNVDVVVVSIHWGQEYQRTANEFQVDLGHKMVDWGANIILGSHPHVLQKSEIIKKDGRDNFIIYSMGNFISNQRQETMGNSYAEDGVIVKLNIEKDFENNTTSIKNVEFTPTWVHKYSEGGKDQYRVLPTNKVIDGELDIRVSDSVLKRIKKSQDDSLATLKQDNQ